MTDKTFLSSRYSVSGTTPTKHILLPDGEMLATVEGSNTTATVSYIHTDHLTGSGLVTNSSGVQTQLLDYHPFGTVRLNNQSSSFNEKRKFAGHEYDTETGLSYMQARYYDSGTGRFVSQDPAFVDIGDSSGFNEKYGRSLEQHLQNPQALNSYAYGLNNPITFRDPQGEVVPLIIIGAWAAVEFGLSAYDAYSTYQTLASTDSSGLEKAITLGGFAVGLASPGGGYGTVGKSVVKMVDKAVDATKTAERNYTVYRSIQNGVVEYIGHTADFVRRQQEHLRNGRRVKEIDGLNSLSNKSIAKGIEQVLIERFGFSKNGGSLSNKINSIAPTNTQYGQLTKIGRTILKKLGSKK